MDTYIPKPAENEINTICKEQGIIVNIEKTIEMCEKYPDLENYCIHLNSAQNFPELKLLQNVNHILFNYGDYSKEEIVNLYVNVKLLYSNIFSNTSISNEYKKFFKDKLEALENILNIVTKENFVILPNKHTISQEFPKPPDIETIIQNISFANKSITNRKFDPLLQLQDAGFNVYPDNVNFPGKKMGKESTCHLRIDYIPNQTINSFNINFSNISEQQEKNKKVEKEKLKEKVKIKKPYIEEVD